MQIRNRITSACKGYLGKTNIPYLMVKDEMFPAYDQEQSWMTALTTFNQDCAGDSNQHNQTRKKEKRHPDWKEKLKVFVMQIS